MGKIIAVLITLTLLITGCSVTSNDYVSEMKNVQSELTRSMNLTNSTLDKEFDSNEFARKLEINYKYTELLIERVEKLNPPRDLKEAHAHYLNFMKRIRDATLAILKDESDKYENAMSKAEKEFELAQPLLDKFKGE